MKYPNANEIKWNLERDEAIFTIELDDGRPIDCRDQILLSRGERVF